MTEEGEVEVIAAATSASIEPVKPPIENDKSSGKFDANALLEERIEWRTVSKPIPCNIPASATCIVLPRMRVGTDMKDVKENDEVLFIGGNSHSNKGLYLDVSVFSFKDFRFTSHFIETNRVINRIGHSCVTYEDKVLCFGGASTQTGMSLGQVVSVELNDFGIKSQLVSYNERISGVGLSSDLYGLNNDQIILFGGLSAGTYSNALTKFRPNKETPAEDRFVPVEVIDASEENPHPSPRAYHSSTTCGSKNQFLVIIGGRTKNGTLLDDIWVTDLSCVDDAHNDAEEEVDQKAKKPPPKKGKQPAEEEHPHACHWRKIEVSNPDHVEILTRSLHTACKLPSSSSNEDSSVSLAIFNGVSKYGLPIACGYRIDIDLTSFTLTTCEIIAKEDECTYLPGSCSLLEKNSEGGPSMAALISGNSLYYLSLDASSGISATLLSMTTSERKEEQIKHNEEEKYQSEHTTPSQQSYDSGEQYKGDMIQDPNITQTRSCIRHGQGEMTYKNGMRYKGSWEMDCRQGHGILTFPRDLGSYEGEFVNDIMEGVGKITLMPGYGENGSDVSFLSGIYVDANEGFNYEGNFIGGKLHGYGTLKTSSGNSYVGNFEEGRFSGKGTLEDKDGNKYSGGFVLGKKNDDNAMVIYPDQSKYEGSFRSDKRNGHGILTSSRGKIIYKGKWVGDKFCGAGEWNTPKNERYVGLFEEGYPCGKGTLYRSDGSIYTGEFRYGKREGPGKTVFVDGSVEEGEYSRNELVS